MRFWVSRILTISRADVQTLAGAWLGVFSKNGLVRRCGSVEAEGWITTPNNEGLLLGLGVSALEINSRRGSPIFKPQLASISKAFGEIAEFSEALSLKTALLSCSSHHSKSKQSLPSASVHIRVGRSLTSRVKVGTKKSSEMEVRIFVGMTNPMVTLRLLSPLAVHYFEINLGEFCKARSHKAWFEKFTGALALGEPDGT